MSPRQLLHARLMIVPIERAQIVRVIGDDAHSPGGCFDMLDEEGLCHDYLFQCRS
jgi:hypothetical protein